MINLPTSTISWDKKMLFSLFFSCLSFSAPAQQNDLSTKIDRIMHTLVKDKNFSGVVVVAKDGKPLYKKAFGFADFENHLPNRLDTKFCIGSYSKVFTAAAIMKLQELGKLNISDKLNKYISDFPQADKITIIDLLQHTSGIKREQIDDDEASRKHYTTAEIIDSLKKYPLDFEPGTKQSYSNGGYAVLARIVEIASGKSYAKFLKENIFNPAEMQNTLDYNSLFPAKNTAKGYDPAPFPKGIQKTLYEDPSQNIGAGSIYSTAPDMLKWDRCLYNESILKKGSLDTMIKYGFGFGVFNRDGHEQIGHDGIVNGYVFSMESFRNDGLCILFLCNIRTGVLNVLQQGLCDLYYNNSTKNLNIISKNKIVLTPAELRQYTGVFELFPGFNINIKEEKGNLYLCGKGGYFTSLNSVAKGLFFYRALFAKIDFNVQPGQTGFIWRDIVSGKQYPVKRIK